MEGQSNGQETGIGGKKRKIQMDSLQCLAHSNSDSGAFPLTSPNDVKTSSQDSNRGLYPKQLKFDKTKMGPEERQSTSKAPCASSNGASSHELPSTSKSPCLNDNSAGATAAACSDILDDFENDTAFDCMEVFDLVEKAESDTSSPVKSVRDWGSPYKTFLPDGTASPCRNFQGEGETLFAKLPLEVMENIFCRMPMIDLCLGVNLVCTQWNNIITRNTFLTWKKKYHKYKLLKDSACTELYGEILKHDMDNEQTCLLQIIKYVHDFRNWRGASMVEDLKQHHNFELAKDLIKKRAPEHVDAVGQVNPWCLIAALAILAENVGDVSLIIKCLLGPLATCAGVDVSECLYCVATFLLMLQRRQNTNRGLHYRVYYALYLYENSHSDIGTTSSFAERGVSRGYGTESGNVRLTHEQKRIVNYDPKHNEVIKIVAFAGAGKTTTLIRYAQRRPHLRFLYVAFNKSVAVHADRVFPSNVTAKTIHSLAYRSHGGRFSNRVSFKMKPKDIHKFLPPRPDEVKKGGLHWITRAKLVIDTMITFMSSTEEFITTLHVPFLEMFSNRFSFKMKPKDIHKLLPPRPDEVKKGGLHWITRAKLVIDTMITFMSSTEEFITTLHVPKCYMKTISNDKPADGEDRTDMPQRMLVELDHRVKMKLADDATLVWQTLIDKNSKERVPHDLYLKLYQLSKPRILAYDCILIDEAQDLTPATQDILLRQTCSKILVGDPNQQIYSFRGAQNAMNQIQRHVGEGKVIKTFHLTQSFRFGPEIAYVSNLLLEFFKNNTTQNIVGTDKPCGFHGDEVGQVAIICRTNVGVFDQAVQICEDAKKDNKRVKLAFAGGIDGYGLDMLMDIYVCSLPRAERYKQPHKIKNWFVKGFDSFYDLKSYAANAMDGELEMKVAIVQKYGSRVPGLVNDIRRTTISTLEYADIVLSTSHKAKGLEFDTVKLTEDYTCIDSFLLSANGQQPVRIQGDEFNMVYVAVTRAKKRLVLNYGLMKFLEYAMETFESPASTKAVLANHDTVPQCLECKALIEAKNNEPLIMKRPKLELCFMRPQGTLPPNDGYLCAKCSAQCCKWFHVLCGQEPERPKNDNDSKETNDSYDFDDMIVADGDGVHVLLAGGNG